MNIINITMKSMKMWMRAAMLICGTSVLTA